ncbi:hypothetical protein [Streptomyces poonensis]|uniref:hypothetical protein n=1 Tax=Streptomyces poonensis TaxID=68255 RepID=UPI00167A8E79|nr:hypothetical protein [Streptomyces poonensis]
MSAQTPVVVECPAAFAVHVPFMRHRGGGAKSDRCKVSAIAFSFVQGTALKSADRLKPSACHGAIGIADLSPDFPSPGPPVVES